MSSISRERPKTRQKKRDEEAHNGRRLDRTALGLHAISDVSRRAWTIHYSHGYHQRNSPLVERDDGGEIFQSRETARSAARGRVSQASLRSPDQRAAYEPAGCRSQ